MKKTILIPIFFVQQHFLHKKKIQNCKKQQQEIIVLKEKLYNQQSVINQQKTELKIFSAKAEKQIDILKAEE